MKRLIFTLFVSVVGFAAIVSFGDPDVRFDEASLDRARGDELPGDWPLAAAHCGKQDRDDPGVIACRRG